MRSAVALAYAASGITQAPNVYPGATGGPTRDLSADEAIDIASTSYSPADVQFMQS